MNLYMYLSLEVHTEDTLSLGERELLKYGKLMKVS